MELHVDCYSGSQAEEKPKCFRLGERKIEVIKILSQWFTPDHKYFKVLGDDQQIYLLQLDVRSWQWSIS